LVFAIAAISLNMILGYGGMVSFGHALYMGLGAYCVGIMASHGIANGWLQVIVMMLACALVGLLTGLISLRTTGIAFIMITLAFAQMFYYLFVSLKPYGGDDGMSLELRSNFTFLDLGSPITLYYVALLAVVSALYVCARTVDARFGMVLRGCRLNERRMKALGFATTRYKLLAYVWSCMLCGMSGVLYANLTGFTSPAYLAWTVSGELIVMVVLGGMGTIFGPLVGALTLLVSEEILKAMTDHWMAILGPLIVLVVLTAKRGLYGYLLDWDAARARLQSLWTDGSDGASKTGGKP
jgi:branched-chain amino acid transport system permease protein